MKRPTDTETDFDLRRSIARLAPYRPFDAEGKLKVEIVHRELILVAIQENGGTVGSIGECQDICNALWEMELEIHDIRDVVQRLQKAGKAGYELTPAAAKELADRVREASETEAVAFNQWETTLVSIAPGLTTD